MATNYYTSLFKKSFAFLVDEYDMKTRKLPQDQWDRKWLPSIAYANSTTGALICYDVRDAHLSVDLYRLTEGQFPLRHGRVSSVDGYALNAFIFMTAPDQFIRSWLPTGEVEKASFEDYVDDAARKLRLYADDFLRGDFSRASQASAAIERMQEFARS